MIFRLLSETPMLAESTGKGWIIGASLVTLLLFKTKKVAVGRDYIRGVTIASGSELSDSSRGKNTTSCRQVLRNQIGMLLLYFIGAFGLICNSHDYISITTIQSSMCQTELRYNFLVEMMLYQK